ncbi:hypothetical protein KL86DES1_21164 [uncultured Desulfovibrio sp.]|uniref:Uncharacterized protein n=1 Tax=uncultured Desulfovibrio sp. TaxID=167968 RepID=A0A212L6T7_9BACT|nr:hypothetical protein KL86DES1_21164 [uncultured Desulfovibrio sp.]VZH34060.1 conserved protein of unknown function [Desulfovibrio sp. 86]
MGHCAVLDAPLLHRAPATRDARKLVFSTEGISFPALRRVFSYLWTHIFFAAFVKT